MEGIVSLPHGWGHGGTGTAMGVAAAHPGVSINDVTDETFQDIYGRAITTGDLLPDEPVKE